MVIYTAVFGDTPLPAPRSERSSERHVLFSPQNVTVAGWQTHPPVWPVSSDPRFDELRHKAMAHVLFPHEPFVLWVHPRVLPKFNLADWAAKWLQQTDIAARKDPESCCVYQRSRWLARQRPELAAELKSQRSEYMAKSLPYFAGLLNSDLLVRRQSPIVSAWDVTWWEQLQRYPSVPELSLAYCAWFLRLRVSTVPGRFGEQTDAFVSTL